MKAPSYKSKVRQKRGFGKGPSYKPWIKVGEFSGHGNSVRSLGLKTGREHHFHSNKEAEIFYILDLNPEIKDIQEQHPLIDFKLAQAIAQEAGIRYPDGIGDDPHIITTDLLVIYKSGRRVAYTFKYLKDMAKSKRQLELFEIERRYWLKQGVEFYIITEEHIPERAVRLVYKDLHASCRHTEFELVDYQNVYAYLLQEKERENANDLPSILKEINLFFNYEKGKSLRLLKIMIARRLIATDLTVPITDINKLLSHLTFNLDYAAAISESDLAA